MAEAAKFTKTMQYCRCRINLAGQNFTVVNFDEFNAVTWPEIQVLMAMHGEENVMDIVPVGVTETYPTTEKNRLAALYGARIVEQCFPGRSFRMEFMMTEDADLPAYFDGRAVDGPKPPPEPAKPAKPANPPPQDPPGTDHDDGEDEDTPAAAAAGKLEPIFKPGRHKPPADAHKGA